VLTVMTRPALTKSSVILFLIVVAIQGCVWTTIRRQSHPEPGLHLSARAPEGMPSADGALMIDLRIRNTGASTFFRDDPLLYRIYVIDPSGNLLAPVQNRVKYRPLVEPTYLTAHAEISHLFDLRCVTSQFPPVRSPTDPYCDIAYRFSTPGEYRIVIVYGSQDRLLRSDTARLFVRR
jgi:hypothetical protein